MKLTIAVLIAVTSSGVVAAFAPPLSHRLHSVTAPQKSLDMVADDANSSGNNRNTKRKLALKVSDE